MTIKSTVSVGIFALATVLAGAARAQPAVEPVPVTADNFIRAETDLYFGNVVKDGGFGKFHHNRELMPIDKQTVTRSNRDTLYSTGVFDLDAGVVTVFLPDAKGRFMSMQVITQDHYAPDVVYEPGRYSFSREKYVTRYILLAIRTLVDPNKPGDLDEVHALQDSVQVMRHGSGPGAFEVPRWDPASQKKVRDALLVLASTLPDLRSGFGRKEEVDPVRHLIGTAAGWGGNPDKEATYLNVTPERNDGKTAYKLTVKDVPVDGFWSISVYNAQGYFEKNASDAYTLNNLTAEKNSDGSVTVQFGGCDEKTPNCLPIMPGWNYSVRLYRPRPEILDGTWKFPEAEPVIPEGGNTMLDGAWTFVQLNGKPVAGDDITIQFDTAVGRASGS
ncbi:MAG TPA: DUF1214 domain-containing protein [Lacipirellulaceae bacterium]